MDLMSFDITCDIHAALKRDMRIHYGGAYPLRNQSCTELLTSIVVLKGKKRAASALPLSWVLSHVSMTIPELPSLGNWSNNFVLPVRTAGMYHGSLTWLDLIFRMNSGVKCNVTPASLGLKCIYYRSNTKAWSSLCLSTEAMIKRKTQGQVLKRGLSLRFIKRLTRTSRTIPRSHCGRTGINLGLSDSIDIIMSETGHVSLIVWGDRQGVSNR